MTLMGQHTVPLIVNHAATLERWSLNSRMDVVEEQISDDNMPGFEIMFKAEGEQVEAKLQAYVSKKKILGMRVIIRGNGAERLIPRRRHSNLPGETFAPWGPACRWEMFLLDEGSSPDIASYAQG